MFPLFAPWLFRFTDDGKHKESLFGSHEQQRQMRAVAHDAKEIRTHTPVFISSLKFSLLRLIETFRMYGTYLGYQRVVSIA